MRSGVQNASDLTLPQKHPVLKRTVRFQTYYELKAREGIFTSTAGHRNGFLIIHNAMMYGFFDDILVIPGTT
jgi:hypothetical protein